jgi:lipoprotein-anchoring transpeptidase ErfK/SrfK
MAGRSWKRAAMPKTNVVAIRDERGRYKAIHGFAGSVGGPASHGCVRLSTGNAKTLFGLVEQQQGLAGFKYDTTIIVR